MTYGTLEHGKRSYQKKKASPTQTTLPLLLKLLAAFCVLGRQGPGRCKGQDHDRDGPPDHH